jgi:hypothetical protein
LAQCVGVGCVLVRVVAGEEPARKVFNLEGPPGDGETSRLGSRDPVDGGTRCGPHGGETSKTKSWTIELVHGGGRVKRLNTTEMGSGRVGKLRSGGHAVGSHGLRREDTGCGEGVAVRWQDPQTLLKCPCVGCIASS